MTALKDLPGLGPKSEQMLKKVGIHTQDELFQLGPVNAYLRLQRESTTKPSLNFLYALVGAVEGRPWQQVAQQDKARLLMELEGLAELEKMINR